MKSTKCWKGFKHIWKKIQVTTYHEIYECQRCKGKWWKLRRGIF
jgi:hypothetical protein